MKIAFFTSYMNHHQVGVADELYRLTGGDYAFVVTKDVRELIRTMSGYSDIERPYVLKAYESEQNRRRAVELARSADIAIFGGLEAHPYIRARYRDGGEKITFEYTERWLKRGWMNVLSPRLMKWWWFYQRVLRRKRTYCLCSSAFAATDMRRLGAYRGRCYKWAYFTAVPALDAPKLEASPDVSSIRILTVSRFLYLKHPEAMVALAERLKAGGYNVHIDMVGEGPLLESTRRLARERGVSDRVHFLGVFPNAEVMNIFRTHPIFCFTSDRNEGWGAVLNEAMSCGCCPVASDAIGAAPFLIRPGENGLLFASGHWDDLYDKVKYLLEHPAQRAEMAANAMRTMQTVWNPETGARRLFDLSRALLSGETVTFADGPCAVSEN